MIRVQLVMMKATIRAKMIAVMVGVLQISAIVTCPTKQQRQ